jgi:hypothetical protein
MNGGISQPVVQTQPLYRILTVVVLLHYNSRAIYYRPKIGNSISKLAENTHVRTGIKEVIRD